MKYRSRTDIVAQILEAANEGIDGDGRGGATKTKIMYKAYLSYAQLKEYLAVLVESGLLQVVENGSTTSNNNQTYYRTAEKGWQFLKLYNSIGELANSGSSNSNNHANVSSSSATTAEVTEMMPKDTTVSSVKIIQYKKK